MCVCVCVCVCSRGVCVCVCARGVCVCDLGLKKQEIQDLYQHRIPRKEGQITRKLGPW